MRFDSQLCNHVGSHGTINLIAMTGLNWGKKISLFSRNASHVAGDICSIAAKQKHDMVALILHSIPSKWSVYFHEMLVYIIYIYIYHLMGTATS